ncbi:MAG: hypothetical protein Q7R34_05445 [Dehalococcoidia bacterium]|nr:hypothetical protein [Dehalococcoidia bacterium]
MSVEIGLGVLSIVIAVVASWIAVSSDRKMKAIANLEFDEKRAMIELHSNVLRKDYDKSHFDRLHCDIEALGHVASVVSQRKLYNYLATNHCKEIIETYH